MKTERVRRKEFKYNNNSNNIDFGVGELRLVGKCLAGILLIKHF